MVWFWLDDSPDKAKWLTKEDKKCLQEMMDNDRLDAGSARGSHQPPRHATTQYVAGDLHSGGDDVYPSVFLPDQHT